MVEGMTRNGAVVLLSMTLIVAFFLGKANAQMKSVEGNEINIGLLISDSAIHEARQAAEMAINEANSNNDLHNKTFQLVVRSMEGPWGNGAKQTVDLVFNEQVYAIVGSLDGRNAHLAEQVIAKTHVPFVSAWASDPTLYQAFVPWYFSIVPNNIQQSTLLINKIYSNVKETKIITITDDGYDSKIAFKSFTDELSKRNLPLPNQFVYDNIKSNSDMLAKKMEKVNCDAIILFTQAETSLSIINRLLQRDNHPAIFGGLSIFGGNYSGRFKLADYEDVILIDPGYWSNPKGKAFSEIFQEEYGCFPGAVAAYAYDGIKLIIETLKKSDFKRNLLEQNMKQLNYYGITGSIKFDKNGSRINSEGLTLIQNGNPQTLGK